MIMYTNTCGSVQIYNVLGVKENIIVTISQRHNNELMFYDRKTSHFHIKLYYVQYIVDIFNNKFIYSRCRTNYIYLNAKKIS
jgi:hypothetical protein